jgi:hypothetical protein
VGCGPVSCASAIAGGKPSVPARTSRTPDGWHRQIVERSPARAAQNLQGLRSKEEPMDLIWIIVIVLIVLALLGYFGRGRFR